MISPDICCILNYASFYRENILKQLEKQLDCDFYFGNISAGKLKKMDYSIFKKNIVDLKTKIIFSHINWISNSVKLSYRTNYKKYILTGDIYCLSNWFILLINRVLGKETFLWTHGWYGDENAGKKILKKIFFGLSHGLFLYGDYAKNLMIKEGFKKEKLHVIYNSLDYNSQIEIRKETKVSTIDYFSQRNIPVVVFTGRLTKVKKLNLLIEAHKKLIDRSIYFNVLLLGNGPEVDLLKEIIQSYHIEQYYWFYGACYDENIIGNFYYNATLCVSPGNVGLTAIHAMTYGCPVISHSNFSNQMPEFECIEKGITGDFFDENNVDSLADTIEKWMHNNYPKSQYLINQCFEKIDSKFNPDYQISIFKKVLL
jgi:glycosyltransferase involved in cell wall biosynthesis